MTYKIITLSIVAMLSGCTLAIMKPVNEGVAVLETEVKNATESMRKIEPVVTAPNNESNIKRVDKVWLPVHKIEAVYNQKVIASLNRTVAVNRKLISLNEAVSYITLLTGIPASNSAPIAVGGSGAAVALPPPPLGVLGQPGSVDVQSMVAYNGKLSGLLDLLAARYNVSWEWEGNEIVFFKTKSKTFRLVALPGSTNSKSKVGGSGGSAGAGQEAGTEFSGLSVWTGIEDSIKAMLSPSGKITVTPATGTITVVDTPLVLERISKYVDDQNVALSRQVVINIKVLSVNLNNSDEYGINWNAVYNNVNKKLGFSLQNAINADVAATNLTFKVLSGSMWDGSTAMIEALSKQGKVSQVTSASMVTLNNQPAPIQVGRQTTYLASSTTTVGVGGAGNTTTLQPGIVTTGFSMNMLPHILSGNKLMLQYSGDLSTLIKITTVSSGTSSIQTPEVDTRNFLQRVIMNGGETLVVTGFEQFDLAGETQGVGSAENIALGGGVRTKNNKTVLVVLIQPVLNGGK